MDAKFFDSFCDDFAGVKLSLANNSKLNSTSAREHIAPWEL